MTKIKYGIKEIQIISVFEKSTGARIKDCIINDESVIFIVHEGEIGKAIGKQGRNVVLLERALKKRVKIVEFSDDLIRFINSLISPLVVKHIEVDGDLVVLTPPDSKTRGLLIGRGASNLRAFESIAQRYFPVREIRVR